MDLIVLNGVLGKSSGFRLGSGIADGTAMPIATGFQRGVAVLLPGDGHQQRGRGTDAEDWEPLARGSCPD